MGIASSPPFPPAPPIDSTAGGTASRDAASPAPARPRVRAHSEPETARFLGLPAPSSRRALPARDHAVLTFVEGPQVGRIVTLRPGSSLTIGRGASARAQIPDESISRTHAVIVSGEHGYTIEDLESACGTWVDGERVRGRSWLRSGARIQLGGRVRVRFDLADAMEVETIEQLHDAAMRDPLTGAYTRRYLTDRLHAELSYASRHAHPVTLLMIDIDRFKRVNDLFGHPAGDAVLRTVTRHLRAMVRPEDVVVRYGGEELCLLLRGLDATSGSLLAERLREAIAQLRIPYGDHVIRTSVSIGVAQAEPDESREGLLRRADDAMYRAKARGRNRCCLHTGETIEDLAA